MRRRVTLRAAAAVTVGSLAALGALACSDPVVHHIGHAMLDAGQSLVDSGLADAQTDAAAPALVEFTADVACNTVYQRDESSASQGSRSVTSWYAETALPAASPSKVHEMTAVLCTRQVYGSATETCLPGWTCTGASRPATVDCRATSSIEVDATTLRVACGQRTVLTNTTTSEYGERWATARVRVRYAP